MTPQFKTCGSSKGFRTEFSSSELSLLLLSRRCRDDDFCAMFPSNDRQLKRIVTHSDTYMYMLHCIYNVCTAYIIQY